MTCRVVERASCRRDLTSVIRSHFERTNGVARALRPREPGREPPAPPRERTSVPMLPDAMPSRDRRGMHALGLRRAGSGTIPAMRPGGPGATRLSAPGLGWGAGRGEA